MVEDQREHVSDIESVSEPAPYVFRFFIVSILPSSHLGSQLEERRYRFTFSLMSRYPKTRADREITQLASLPCKPSTCMTRRGSGVQIPHGPRMQKRTIQIVAGITAIMMIVALVIPLFI